MPSCANFEQETPGTAWAGQRCKNCEFRRKDHADANQAGASSAKDEAEAARVKQAAKDAAKRLEEKALVDQGKSAYKPVNPQRKGDTASAGIHQGSLASFIGGALGVQHTGRSTGLVKSKVEATRDTQDYHASQERQQLAKSMGNIMKTQLPPKKE